MRRRLRRIVGSDRVLPAAGVCVGHVKLLVCIRVYDFPAPHPRVRARDAGAVGCSYCSEPGRQRARMSPLAMTLPVPLFDPLAHQAPVLRASFWIQKPRLPRPIRPGKAKPRRPAAPYRCRRFGVTCGACWPSGPAPAAGVALPPSRFTSIPPKLNVVVLDGTLRVIPRVLCSAGMLKPARARGAADLFEP